MVYKAILIFCVVGFLFSGCDKAKLEGNSKEYEETNFELVESISLAIPNTIFTAGGLFSCVSLPFNISYDAFIPTENPNPFAKLARNMIPLEVEMEMTQVEGNCGFAMLDFVEVYLCLEGIDDPNDFTFRDPNNPNADFNAVKVGQFLNIPDGVGNKINLDVEPNAVLDKFIKAGDFLTYTKMAIDKGFTNDYAIIKTKLKIAAQLDNAQ